VLLAAREFASLLRSFPDEVAKDDIMLVIGIDSETDHLPIGSERQHWNPNVLAQKDVEIAKCEAHYKPLTIAACERILLAVCNTRLPPN